ncbi:head GIN domain-containing protein [Flavobacterium subsaxonicum]|uniref:Putative auto-transporter adhesin head GIN domain-containing protein n=1 Tax=Flavobacterium subsaxonicum WB 4.1-42 = DSM 21790 TaxID=1121898 RepID=A0A0A2MNH0_9FLAO|nr:head GIN domain-containing protein [Flavobacterium subsaxonicum]KGO94182.1 hypothetical protein Q766_04435 [Flavobacterium subsaxonicum WB 4.1-42 = DSM 21790]
MNKLRLILLMIFLQLFTGCNSESANECIRTAGATTVYDVPVTDFTTIYLSVGIELVITEGPEQKVTVKTGDNIMEYISAEVIGTELHLTNANNCNWVHDYNTTTVYVTTPHLEKIYSASQFAVKSDGVLTFPTLSLQSGIFNETASGTFELEVNCENLTIEDNQSAYYVISGAVENLNINFYAGDARFEGLDLIAQKLTIFHRSSNDIIARPQQEVTGKLLSTGNLVLKSNPPIVDVEKVYTGSVVYE